jgi:hypothetical protein
LLFSPSFRGAGRDRCPLPLLQAMGTSGLFESWRIIEVGREIAELSVDLRQH